MDDRHPTPGPSTPDPEASLLEVIALVEKIARQVDAQTGRIEGPILDTVTEDLLRAERTLMVAARWALDRWMDGQRHDPLSLSDLPSLARVLATAQHLKQVCTHVNVRLREQVAAQPLN